ncbi:hypothetical protein KY348_06000 [Candidatus Woesearchaeota archaeon]|nr:hypothetical protein [Candidatus Woesearchaeota archaeon]
MNKGLIALVLISLLVLFIIGCKVPTEKEAEAGEEQAQETGEVTEEPDLTGDITEVDDLDTELSEDELGDIDSSLDELNW